MTKTEALKLVATVKLAYPVYYRNVANNDLEAMADLWAAVLDDYSYNDCFTAIKTYLRAGNKEILQSPGQIVDEIEKLKAATRPEGALTAVQAWERYVRPAIRDGLYHAAENYEKMPEIVRTAIHSADYLKELAQLSSETIDSVERSNFINRLYPTAVKRSDESARMPEFIRVMIENKRKENEQAEECRIEALDDKPAIERKQVEQSDHSEQIAELERSLIG